jgi:hypothetical protein
MTEAGSTHTKQETNTIIQFENLHQREYLRYKHRSARYVKMPVNLKEK